jgi:hypothetical protein
LAGSPFFLVGDPAASRWRGRGVGSIMASSLAQDILALRLWVDPGMTDQCERVQASLAAEGEGAPRFSFQFPELRPPAPVGWFEWEDGIVLGLWWRRDKQSIDVCCFHRTADGKAAMVCAITGYRLGSSKFELTFSKDLFEDEAHAIAAASDYLRIFAIASALHQRRN